MTPPTKRNHVHKLCMVDGRLDSPSLRCLSGPIIYCGSGVMAIVSDLLIFDKIVYLSTCVIQNIFSQYHEGLKIFVVCFITSNTHD